MLTRFRLRKYKFTSAHKCHATLTEWFCIPAGTHWCSSLALGVWPGSLRLYLSLLSRVQAQAKFAEAESEAGSESARLLELPHPASETAAEVALTILCQEGWSSFNSRTYIHCLQHGFDHFLSRLETADYEPEAVRGRVTTRDTRNKVLLSMFGSPCK